MANDMSSSEVQRIWAAKIKQSVEQGVKSALTEWLQENVLYLKQEHDIFRKIEIKPSMRKDK